MPFDPTLPAANTPNSSAQMRAQLNGLKDLIDNIGSVTSAQVDAVTTLPAGDAATVDASITGGVLHFSFGIPRGNDGSQGNDGAQGPPGEVTLNELANVINSSSANSNNVGTLGLGVNDPPSGADLQQVVNKLDELILALRR